MLLDPKFGPSWGEAEALNRFLAKVLLRRRPKPMAFRYS